MAKLPLISGKRAIDAFGKAGWVVVRQSSSHVVLKKPGYRLILTIPLHKELDRGLLRHQVRVAGLSVDEFCSLL